MYKLLAITFLAAIAVILSERCHVSDTDAAIHCDAANNMSCKGVEYTPFCQRISQSSDGLNGVCTCDEFCFTDDECQKGCSFSSRYSGVCQETSTNSITKVCLCKRNN